MNRILKSCSSLKLCSYADFANLEGRTSISGYVAMPHSRLVSWGSKRQWSVSTSSTESEYIAIAIRCKQGLRLAEVLRIIDFSKYVGKDHRLFDLSADNQGAAALVKNSHLHERSKHIDICYHFMRDKETRKVLHIKYEPRS